MTYIIAGKLPQRTFMMSDCIVTNVETNQKTLINKTIKLESSLNTFYSFTGVQFIDNCVRTYDFWLTINNRNNDFITGHNSIKELQNVIKQMLKSFTCDEMELEKNRLFFINENDVVYYDLEFNENNELVKDSEKNILKSNEFIDSSVFTGVKEGIPEMEIEEFCKSYLEYLSGKNIDFKNRFSFVHYHQNNLITFKEPFKQFSDLIAMYNNIDYDKLDDQNFKWTI